MDACVLCRGLGLRSQPPGRATSVLGRHSRPEREEWPATRADILEVYPDSDEFDVRLLGVGSYLRTIVGEPSPKNWTAYEFGEVAPDAFLRSIDFSVTTIIPIGWKGSGRTVAEAASSGAVLILPEYLRPTFGDAALYREPADVLGTVREFYADWDADSKQSRIARQSIDRSYGPAPLLRRVGKLIGEPDPQARQSQQVGQRRGRSAGRNRLPGQPLPASSAFDVLHLGDMQTRRESARVSPATSSGSKPRNGYLYGAAQRPRRPRTLPGHSSSDRRTGARSNGDAGASFGVSDCNQAAADPRAGRALDRSPEIVDATARCRG